MTDRWEWTVGETQDSAAITVVIATFNRRDMLERAVRSALDEHRVPILLHVHDNASTDDTEAFMKALVARDPRVRYTRNPTNVGSLANITGGLGTVRSKYFVPLADDDYFLPDFLFDAHAILENDGELAAAAFFAEARDGAGRLVNTWPNNVSGMAEGKILPADHLRMWMVGSHYSWQAILWRSDVLEHLGPPYLHTGLPSDVDFQAQIFVRFPVHVVRRPGAVFSVHEGQESNRLSVADVPSWTKLFSRLDKAVEMSEVLPRDEYLRRRAVMWQRMRPSWLRPSKAPLPLASLARLAASAGFRLGDWELAFHLAAEVRKRQAQARSASAESGTSGVQESRIGSHLDLAIGILETLHGGMQREQTSAKQIEALVASLKTLQDATLAVTADRNRLAAELAALRLEPTGLQRQPGSLQESLFPPKGDTGAFVPALHAAG